MLTFIDNVLNKVTMYRLMFYYLAALIVIAGILGGFGFLAISPVSLTFSFFIILGACWIVNKIFGTRKSVPTNTESFYITAFILTLIISPIKLAPFDFAGLAFLLWASLFAMASKYLFAIKRKHIFNPVAIAVALTAFFFGQYASWWAGGNLVLLPFVLIGGLLVVRKVRRFDLVLTFFAASIVSILLTNSFADPLTTIEKALVHTTILFFGFVMLTEPLTTPPTRSLRILYGGIVGLLFSPLVHIGSIYSTPELTLIVGNIFSYFVSPKEKYVLTLRSKTEVGTDTYDFAFAVGSGKSEKKIKFRPGQYMEFTLANPNSDLRGNRRYFTIASSPTEDLLHLGVKFYDQPSTFKQKLLAFKPGDRLLAGSLAGDFTLPTDPTKKLAFIAGGIGITPFRSMIQAAIDGASATDKSARRDITLLYSNRTASEIAYADVFGRAEKTIGLKTVYVNTAAEGRIDANFIKREVPDWHERTFYISGTHAMVVSFEKILHDLGVPRRRVKLDFFPGFV